MSQGVVIAGTNAIFAFVACIVLWAIAGHVGNSLKVMLRVGSLLAFAYSVGYWWLLFNLEHQRGWSGIMQWFGLVAWPLIWISIPVTMLHWATHRAGSLVSGVQKLVDKFESGETL